VQVGETVQKNPFHQEIVSKGLGQAKRHEDYCFTGISTASKAMTPGAFFGDR
jgi:hypothetical protein